MRRHVIGVCRGGCNPGVHAGGAQTLFSQHGVVVAMNDVVGDTGMVGLLGENRFEYLAALTLIGKGLIGFGRRNGEREGVEDSSFTVIGICRPHRAHLLLEGLGVSVSVFTVVAVNFRQSVDKCCFAGRGPRIGSSDLLGLVEGIGSGRHVTVVPQTMVVRHGNAPLRHGTFRILTGDFSKGLPGLLVLERMQQGNGTIEAALYRFRTRSRKMDGANFLVGECVMMFFVTPSPGHEKGEDGKQNSRQSHKASFQQGTPFHAILPQFAEKHSQSGMKLCFTSKIAAANSGRRFSLVPKPRCAWSAIPFALPSPCWRRCCCHRLSGPALPARRRTRPLSLPSAGPKANPAAPSPAATMASIAMACGPMILASPSRWIRRNCRKCDGGQNPCSASP